MCPELVIPEEDSGDDGKIEVAEALVKEEEEEEEEKEKKNSLDYQTS